MVFWIAAVTQGVALGWFVWPLQGRDRRSWIRRKIRQPIIFRVETIPLKSTPRRVSRVAGVPDPGHPVSVLETGKLFRQRSETGPYHAVVVRGAPAR